MNLTQSTAIQLERYQDLHLSVDFERETALLDGTRMKLTYKAFALLALLVRHPGQLIPRDTLLLLVWGYGADIRTRTLDVHIRHLRKSLGSYGDAYIETVFGVGYRLQPCRAKSELETPDTSPALALGATATASQAEPAHASYQRGIEAARRSGSLAFEQKLLILADRTATTAPAERS
jgi:DNA-binding winged helix-turn-helix (wHTH) protein